MLFGSPPRCRQQPFVVEPSFQARRPSRSGMRACSKGCPAPFPMAAQTREGPEAHSPAAYRPGFEVMPVSGAAMKPRGCALHARYGVQKIESRREAAGADDDVASSSSTLPGMVHAEVAPLVEPEA